MKRYVVILALLAVVLSGRRPLAEDQFPGAEWAHVSAAEAGWSKADLAQGSVSRWPRRKLTRIARWRGLALWWTGTSGDTSIRDVRLPKRCFFALGAGAQYAFVIPADDLVAVTRVDRELKLPEPKMSMVALLLDIILKAGGFKPE